MELRREDVEPGGASGPSPGCSAAPASRYVPESGACQKCAAAPRAHFLQAR